MSNPEAYVESMEAKLDDLNSDIAKLEPKSKDRQSSFNENYKEQLSSLKDQREKAGKNVACLQAAPHKRRPGGMGIPRRGLGGRYRRLRGFHGFRLAQRATRLRVYLRGVYDLEIKWVRPREWSEGALLRDSWSRRLVTAVVVVALLGATQGASAAPVASKRDIVILIDNHIFTNKPFEFDEKVLRANIRAMLDYVRPKRVVVFAVGHDGHAQYPSKFFPLQKPSATYPYLKEPGQDLLKIWRAETTRNSTGLIIYVSTLRNDALAETHPEYLRVFGNGLTASVIDHNSAFADDVLLPGLQEIIDLYHPDGFFLDADYWTLHESWNPATKAGFVKKTGLPVPNDYGDASYPAFVRYTYDSYRQDYVEKLEAFFASQKAPLNWSINAAFTVRDPSSEPASYGTVTVDLPFFALGEAHIESLFSQRLKGGAEIVFPLFAQSEGAAPFQYKGKAQLKQELAVAVANRALVSFYLPLGSDGTIDLDRIEPAIAVYDDFERSIGTGVKDPGLSLMAKVAVVNPNTDAVAKRRFEELREVSLHLFERGVLHAMTTETLARQGSYSHLVFPRMDHAEDTSLIPALTGRGKKVLWAMNPHQINTNTKAIVKALKASTDFMGVDLPACPPANGCQVLRANRGGGEVWIVPAIDDGLLDRFVSDVDSPVTFPDKPDYIYALAYGDAVGRKYTIYLSSVAWGGTAFGRHTLFDNSDITPSIRIRLKAQARCIQRTLGGNVNLPPGREIALHPFDTSTKIECGL